MFLIKLFWRFYFFLMLFLFIKFSVPCDIQNGASLIDTAMIIPSLVALFGFAFDRKFLSKSLWRLYFVVLVTWDFYYHFVIASNLHELMPSIEMGFFMILLFPLYLGIFCYAFLQKELKEVKS